MSGIGRQTALKHVPLIQHLTYFSDAYNTYELEFSASICSIIKSIIVHISSNIYQKKISYIVESERSGEVFMFP